MAQPKQKESARTPRKRTTVKTEEAPAKKPVRRRAAAKKESSTRGTDQAVQKYHPLAYEIVGILLIVLAVVIFQQYGVVGRALQSTARFFFGNLHFLIPATLVLGAIALMLRRKVKLKNRVVVGVGLLFTSFIIFSHALLFEQLTVSGDLASTSVLKETWNLLITTGGIENRSNALGGGMIGGVIFSVLSLLFDVDGAKVLAWVLLLVSALLFGGKALMPLVTNKVTDLRTSMKEKFVQWKERKKQEKVEGAPEKPARSKRKKDVALSSDEVEAVVRETSPQKEVDEIVIKTFAERVNDEKPFKANENKEYTKQKPPRVNAEDNTSYTLPTIDVLQRSKAQDQSDEKKKAERNKRRLEETFESFNVRARVTNVLLGPAVTKYEVTPEPGYKISKIVSLQDDLALALAAKDIRIEAPIPGKSAVGIEVPNSEVAVVTLRDVLETDANNKPDEKLLIGFGIDVTGEPILAQLNKMPHLLVAGSTGSGKSVCINGIIVSILMRAKPHEVKMMMIDPKMVELNVYNGIPHLLAPVVTDPRKAAQALQKVVSEMERRYELFSHTGTRNIEGYNDHVMRHNEETSDKQPKLPYIVVIVDELADLMMVASNEVEDAIMRLAQMARAAGIHLIIATQRPSVDVITGIIKANIPSRIAFAVSSAIDSRTILDMGGAEKLLGRGDMLFMPAGVSKPTRVQGAFLSDQEVERITEYVINQQKAQYEESMIPTDEEIKQIDDEVDELYLQAVDLVIELQSASVSMLQRKFKIGYSRAARIVDQMEARGIVGPPEGSKPRKVLTS
ncbi:MAG: DNA translocase FtsK [Caryophanon sp.]|nr:DNA translocase FtsK [Caryophanon sp.]